MKNLEYQVSVNSDGAIVAYEPLETTPDQAAALTPLPELRSIPTGNETVTQFKVVFKPGGNLEVTPLQIPQ